MKQQNPILIAKHGFAKEFGQHRTIFDESDNQYIISQKPFMMMTFGTNVAFRGSEEMMTWCEEHFEDASPERVMDGTNLFLIEQQLRHRKFKLMGQHIYFLAMKPVMFEPVPNFTYTFFDRDSMKSLYQYKGFEMALTYDIETDVLAFAAFDEDDCIAVAACDDRNPDIWQIGIDTRSDYRHMGLATYLVSQLVLRIKQTGKAVSYTTWGANVASMNVAIKCGFVPIMTYYYAKPLHTEE